MIRAYASVRQWIAGYCRRKAVAEDGMRLMWVDMSITYAAMQKIADDFARNALDCKRRRDVWLERAQRFGC